MKKYNILFLFAVSNLLWLFINCATERIRYLSLEHPNVTYYNRKYLAYVNITSRRLSRKDPIHYFNFHFTALRSIDNRLTIRYLNLEHLNVTYYNYKYLGYVNITCRRLSRKDPIHYFNTHFTALRSIDNRVTVDFYFYEWLTNVYKPTFVEMHFKWCDMIHKDQFFGATLKQGNFAKPCPFPEGEYHLYNMSVPSQSIPRTFPFTRGRIYATAFWQKNKDEPKELVGESYMDMEIKTWIKKS